MVKHLILFLFIALTSLSAKADDEISSYAFVREDGALQISNYMVRLYGIYIPPTDRTCYTFIRPVPCGSRALLALEFKIGGDFIRCTPRFSNPDGSITANCRSGDQDLSEWMLQQGWALALPDVPFALLWRVR